MSAVTLKNVTKNFGTVEVIKGVDIEIAEGEFCVFVGPSGCGKSTLLRMIAGLEEITGGTVEIGGRRVNEVDPSQRGAAMVFQTYALYPHMTVEQNLGFGLRMGGMPKEQVATRVEAAAKTLEIDELMHRKPRQLSGGQRQRVAIGRAIVREPKAFLFDEPLSNLDAELRVQMRIEIAKLHHQLGATMVYVTHDQVEAMTLADRIVVLRAGVIEQYGSPIKLYDDPDNIFVAGFIGSPRMNFIGAEVIEGGHRASVRLGDFGHPEMAVATRTGAAKPGDKVTVGIRPEHFVDAAGAPVRLSGRATVVEQLGGVSYVYAAGETTGSQLTVQQKGHSQMASDSSVEFGVDPATALLFEEGGQRL